MADLQAIAERLEFYAKQPNAVSIPHLLREAAEALRQQAQPIEVTEARKADRALLERIEDTGYWPSNAEWLEWLRAHCK